ncbi:MAG: amino acid adenylation domain-containing protein [Polaribacter sp.]
MINTLTDIIKNASEKFPENEAFKCGKKSLNFKEIDIKTNQLAKYLQEAGVKKCDRVGIYMERSVESVIAVYGILKAGAVFVPLDSTTPISRTVFLLNDCNIEHLITTKLQTKKTIKILEEEQPLTSIIGFEKELQITTVSWETIYTISLENYAPVKIEKDDLAYIMYTSGSTGLPKGIMHTHFSGLSYAKLSAKLYQITEKDSVANLPPLHFDQATFGYFSSPLACATTVIIPDAYTKLPASLSKLIEDEKITIWYSVPLALIQLLQKGILEDRNLTSLRWVLFGGEVFVTKYLYQLMQKWPQATFCNVYGPAEVNQCSYYHLDYTSTQKDPIPVGYIWDETNYKILDKSDKEVPQGESGELIINSTTMMRGYWNNETLTEKSFYNDGKKTYYRTGDIFNLNEKGELMFLGRNDSQVKIRGYRIEINEVEAVIANHSDIDEAAVFAIETKEGVKELTAVILLKQDKIMDKKTLFSYCKTLLPSYAIPTRIDIMEVFPRTSSAKIDRGALKRILIEA